MKRIFTFMAAFAFTTVLLFGIRPNASAQDSAETLVGEVTSIDQGMITIKEDTSQTEYELRASSDKLKDLSPGYRVEVKAVNGRVSSLTILGMPMQAQPEPSQKFEGIVK